VAFEYPGFHPVKKTARHAAFLNGPDYHVVIGEKLEQIAKATLAEGAAYKVCVDSSALLEKAWAADAGLGWIGKHGLLINPDVGSRVLLGELLVTELVDSGPVVSEELCGECSRCLSACPTRALLGPGLLEVAKCISFATLEDRSGRLSVSRPEDSGVWVAGCDVCQDVCPHNEKAVCTSHRLERDWTTLLLETDEAYRARVRGTALERVKFSQYRRNLETAVRNK
jgi:epoxyqueuosine reductase